MVLGAIARKLIFIDKEKFTIGCQASANPRAKGGQDSKELNQERKRILATNAFASACNSIMLKSLVLHQSRKITGVEDSSP